MRDAKEERAASLARERRSQLRGLLYLAGAILLFALLRAHWHR
jgi:hypothetical protein